MHPINSVKGAITTGVVIAIVIGIVLVYWAGTPVSFHPVRADRWVHILAGVTWIGLLYYFNVVQTPGLAAAAADKGGPGGAGVTKYIAPRALLWFRWSAVLTWLTGAGYLMSGYGTGNSGAIVSAFTLQSGYRTIGVGAWLGTIMLFNVWVFIWPNQKIALGIKEADADAKARAGRIAMLASRTNTLLSLPMLTSMAMYQTFIG